MIARVARFELVTLLRRPVYLILAVGLPLIGLLVMSLVAARPPDLEMPGAGEGERALEAEGYVDLAGLLVDLPPNLPRGVLMAFPDETRARQALARGEIAAYYVVSPDYLESGDLIYVHPTLNPIASAGDQSWTIRRALLINLLNGDAQLADQIWDPLAVETTDLAAVQTGVAGDCPHPGADCRDQPFLRYIPTFMLVFTFVALTNGASLLMRSVGREKQNRVMEILTSSITPVELMGGKIIGLGIATLLGFATWMLCAGIALQRSGALHSLPSGFALPTGLVPWSAVFFLLGFALFASLMAGIGALVPNLKETTQASWLVMGPMLVGYMVGIFAIDTPHSALMVALSLFPITSPMVMVQRLSIGGVPGWQPTVSAILLLGAVILAMGFAGRLFRAQHLLSGQSFSIRRLLAALRT